MPSRRKAIAFDVDSDSLSSLNQAFPGWEIEALDGATSGSLEQDWNPGKVDLLVVGAHDQVETTLGLCRGLRSQVGRSDTPLLVLVAPSQEGLVKAMLDATAHSCLVLPVHAKSLVSALDRVREANLPGRHTLGLDRAQHTDSWRDHGGEA